jgi:hypothetical protein
MRVDDQREARSSTFRTQLLLEPRVQVTIRLERCKPFVCCWEGAAAPARRQRSTRHPGLLAVRRVRHEAGGQPEVGVSSPAQGATIGCTAANHHTCLRRSTLAETPAGALWPLNDLGALAERPRSTCTLNDRLEKDSAFRVNGGCPKPPSSGVAGCSIAAEDNRLIAPHQAVGEEGATRR